MGSEKKMATEEKKDIFLGKELNETDIPTKKGRKPTYEWDKVLAQITKGTIREINTEATSKATLSSAVKKYNENHKTDLKVVSRTLEDKTVRVFIRA